MNYKYYINFLNFKFIIFSLYIYIYIYIYILEFIFLKYYFFIGINYKLP
jgi:hypothetical protein